MKVKIKNNFRFIKKDLEQHTKNILKNKPIISETQLIGFLGFWGWYVFIPFIAGILSQYNSFFILLILIPLCFRLVITDKKGNIHEFGEFIIIKKKK